MAGSVLVRVPKDAEEDSPETVAPNGNSGDDLLDDSFSCGNHDALRRAYDRYGSLIYSFCCRSLAVDAAADATQEAFVAAWQGRERFDPHRGSLAAWLMGIAKFKVIDQLRRNGHLTRVADAAANEVDHEQPQPDVESIAERMLLADALEQLPSRMRDVVRMAYYDDLTHADIAAASGLPLGTIKSDLRRGVERLRRHLLQGATEHG